MLPVFFLLDMSHKIEATEEPLIARAGLVLPYEMAKSLKLPQSYHLFSFGAGNI